MSVGTTQLPQSHAKAVPRAIRLARAALIWTTTALALTVLAAALFIFVATLTANGADGTALIVDFYQRVVATCL